MASIWTHYGVFKPFVIAMCLAGTFSLTRNTDVPSPLKILSNVYCIVRISTGLGLVIASVLSYILSPEGDEIMYTQALVYTSINAVNITIMVYLSIKSSGFDLAFNRIKQCQEFERRGEKGATPLIGLCLSYCGFFIADVSYQIWNTAFGSEYYQFILLFYPYMDTNHVGTRTFAFTFAHHTPIADTINDATFVAFCWEIGKIFSSFNNKCSESIKSHRTNGMIPNIEELRRTHLNICRHISIMNKIFSVYLGFNIFAWIIMTCGIVYIRIFQSGTGSYILYLIIFLARLTVVMIASGYLNAKVGYLPVT